MAGKYQYAKAVRAVLGQTALYWVDSRANDRKRFKLFGGNQRIAEAIADELRKQGAEIESVGMQTFDTCRGPFDGAVIWFK